MDREVRVFKTEEKQKIIDCMECWNIIFF